MTQPYQLLNDTETVLRVADNACIPNDPGNRDRQEYEKFLADGGVPDPAPPSPEPPPPAPVELPAQPEAPMDAATKSYVDVEVGKMALRISALEAKP